MSQDHYLVVFRDHHWDVTHKGDVQGPFRSREDALKAAIAGAAEDGRNGISAEVRVQEDQDREFRTAWKYGRDPVPNDEEPASESSG